MPFIVPYMIFQGQEQTERINPPLYKNQRNKGTKEPRDWGANDSNGF